MAFRTTHFYVERLMVYSQNGFIHMDGSTTVSSIPGQWVGGSSFPMGGSTSVQFTVTGGGVIPRMRLNQSILGGPQADDEVVGQYRLAQKLGRFPLGGGHLPSWPGKFGTLSIGGQTGVAIGSQKNGIGDEFTSKFGLNISKLCNFTLGFGGTIGVRNISGSLGLVGSTDFTISGTSFTVASADWFKQISPVILNNSFRNPLNEYVHRKDWVQYPTLTNITTTHEGLNYIDLNAFVRPSSLRIIAPDPYVFNQVNFLTNISAWPAMSDASGTVAGKTFRSNPFLCFNYHKVLTDRKLPITYTLGIIGNTSTTISSQGQRTVAKL